MVYNFFSSNALCEHEGQKTRFLKSTNFVAKITASGTIYIDAVFGTELSENY